MGCLFTPGVTEATFTTICGVKLFNQIKFSLNDRNKHHLRDALTGFNGKAVLTTIPDGHH